MLILPNMLMLFTESTGLLTRIVNLVLPLGAFWVAMTMNRNPGKMFWWLFIFMFFNAFEIVLLYLFGESPIAVDMFLNLFTTNVTEADELLAQIYPSVIFVVVVYGLGIVLSIVALRKRLKLNRWFVHDQRVLGGVVLGIGAILLVVNYFVDRRFAVQNDIFPVNVCYNVGLSAQRVVQSERYPATSQQFSHQATLTRSDSVPEIYVLVIGETLRADDMGIYGYHRNTTPHLKALADTTQSLAVFSDALTMSNTTHKSVPMLFTATASQGDYDSLYTQRGIISAFREVGFDTWFVSNQRRNHSFIDYLGCEAEHVCFTKDSLPLSANVYDDELLVHLKKILPSSAHERMGGSIFIVLHCYGSHFDYRDRCPEQYARFGPVDYPSATKTHREKLVNAYDNTIAYADHIVSSVISLLDKQEVPAVMLFTSDHGEDIFDDNRGRFLHASPLPSYYQLRVPMLVWASQQWRDTYPDKWAAVMGHRQQPLATNMVTYHTLLDLAGITTRLLQPVHALGNAQYRPAPRLYVNDHNEMLPLVDCGLKPIDFEQFKAHGIDLGQK